MIVNLFTYPMAFNIANCLFIINKSCNSRVISTDRAGFVGFYFYGAEIHCFGIEGQQPVCKQIADSGEVFQHFGCLDSAQHSGNSTQYSGL